METVTKAQAAILVDYDLYVASQPVRDFVKSRSGFASIVLLVSKPDSNDFNPETHEGDEFQAVIRNSALTPDIVFKTSALCVVQDSSNMIPVIALDESREVCEMFELGGVLIAGV